MKYKLLLFMLLLFSINSVIAEKVTTIQTNTEGIQVFYPDFDYIMKNTGFELHLHISNISNGFPLPNTFADCFLHLYNSTGSHTFQSGPLNKNANGNDFELDILGSNFSDLGFHAYYIWCNSTTAALGGEAKGTFQVTETGKELLDAQSFLYIGFLSLLILIFFLTMLGMNYLPASNIPDEEGRILSINYLKYFRLPLWIFAYFTIVAILFLSSNVALAYLNEEMFGKLLFSMFSVMMALSPIVIIVLVISFFVKFFHDKQFQNMINRGMFPGKGV